MVNTPGSFTSEDSDRILCCYVNATSKLQIVRISNSPHQYLERTVFPGQRLLFEALPQAQLEVHTNDIASAVLADTIPCHRLRVEEEAFRKNS